MFLEKKRNGIILLSVMILIFKTLNLMVQDIHAGEFDFSSSITLAETYDDNIYLDERHDDTEDDFITSVSPGFVLSYLTQKSSLTTSYNPEFLFYSKNPEENEVNHSATLDFTSRLTREVSLNVTDSLTFIPAQDITGRELGARDVPSDEIHNSFSTILSYQIFNPTLLRMGFTHSYLDYEISELEDTYEYSYNLGIDHELTTRDTLLLDYIYRRLFTEGENEADIQSIRIGERHEFPRALLLTVIGGLELIEEHGWEDDIEWSASARLDKSFRRGNVGIAYERYISSTEGAERISINQIISVTGGRNFTRRFNGDITCYFSTEESTAGDEVDRYYIGAILGFHHGFSERLIGTFDFSYVYSNSRVSPDDTEIYRAAVEATYQFGPSSRAFLSYSYYQQEAQYDPFAEDIENNQVTIGIEITWL
ncbi:MAG: hypothetical protein SVY10_06780 [Thermodesulfobacteriota bacterium]|nr:hypothetical protein [Thermodesulfobacteriota bacterium]